MKVFHPPISFFIRHKNFPIVTLFLISLVVGFLTKSHYGESWDEPRLREYANATIYAYSIRERLEDGAFIDEAYGPSNLRYYGPAYLILARFMTSLLTRSPLLWNEIDSWHFVNFLTFLLGALFLFSLCRRWIGVWASSATVLLFVTQPLFWGHAFINLKDIPFLTYFMGSIALGFQMVDRLSKPSSGESVNNSNQLGKSITRLRVLLIEDYLKKRTTVQILFIVLSMCCLSLFIVILAFSNIIQKIIGDLISYAYTSQNNNLLGQIFQSIAPNYNSIPLESYLQKSIKTFARFQKALGIISVVSLSATVIINFKSTAVQLWQSVKGWVIALPKNYIVVAAGLFLGLCTSMRVLGPLAGILVFSYLILKPGRKHIPGFIFYITIAMLVSYFTWPYLWGAPFERFIQSIQVMSNFPFTGDVLFNGVFYKAHELPFSYVPVVMLISLTEPIWILFTFGLVIALSKIRTGELDWKSLILVFGWFTVLLFYLLVFQPALYDNVRQFFFILPPVFIFIGITFQAWFERIKNKLVRNLCLIIVIIPGLYGIIALHPYQYTYYNAYIGGVGGAFRRFETDYWLTSYKEAVEFVNRNAPQNGTLFVPKRTMIARHYARKDLKVVGYSAINELKSGDYLLIPTRVNQDFRFHPQDPIIFVVGRNGAIFSVVKQVGEKGE